MRVYHTIHHHSFSCCRPPPRAYLVSFDISRAFDGVPTAQLLALAQRLLVRPAYTIVKYSEASSGRLF
jgi:hypothetical protein